MQANWVRVSKANSCCVCGRPDWCCLGEKFANCMRVESPKPCTNGGWLHQLDSRPIDPIIIPRKTQEPPPIKAEQMICAWRRKTPIAMIDNLAATLGVTRFSLVTLGASWAHERNAWAFPMHNGYRDIIGIRLRTNEGKKFAVTGSRQGVFIPEVVPDSILWILEGPTDTAAALSLDLFAIGRPSCLGAEDHINDFIRDNRVKRVVVCADQDDPGQKGAEKLQSTLKALSIVYTPPHKDMRAAVNAGLTREMVMSAIRNTAWTQPVNRYSTNPTQ